MSNVLIVLLHNLTLSSKIVGQIKLEYNVKLKRIRRIVLKSIKDNGTNQTRVK